MEHAVAIAKHLGELVARREVGPLALSLIPPSTKGDVGMVVMLAPHKGRWRSIAVMSDLGSLQMVTRVGTRRTRTALMGARVEDASLDAIVDGLVDSIALLDRVPLNAIDCATTILEPEKFRISLWGDADGDSSGASINLGGAHPWGNLVQIMQLDATVEVTVPATEMGGPSRSWMLATPIALVEATPEIRAAIAKALEGRAAFDARPFAIGHAARWILAALEEARLTKDALSIQISSEDFPSSYGMGEIWRTDTLGQHATVTLYESRDGVRVVADGFDHVLSNDAALEASKNELLDAVRGTLLKLTPDKLDPGARYRVLARFRGIAPGEVLTFQSQEYIPKEGMTLYHFDSNMTLRDDNDSDLVILKSLDDHLERI